MAYTPYHADWRDFPDLTTPITAAALEHIEQGVVAVDTKPLDQVAAPTADVYLNNQKLTSVGNPTLAFDATNKAYVDAVATGLDVKMSVRVATTANITLSGTQTIDGVAVIALDRVLVKNQTAGAENGIYVAAAGAWARSADADADAEVTAGMFTFIEAGTTQADQGWALVTNNPITVGTTALVFSQFNSSSGVVAAASVTADSTTLTGVGTNVQAVFEELDNSIADHLADTTAAHAATAISFSAAGGLSSTTVQAAIEEAHGEIDMPGFRSINAYGAVQGGSTPQNTAIAACQAALVADGGGYMFVPPGTTIATPFVISARVRIKGCGKDVSFLAFNTSDPGGYAITHDPSDVWPTHLEDISVTGPGSSSGTIGVNPCATHGVNVGRGSVLRNVHILQFSSGAVQKHDHCLFDNVWIETCYIGVSYPDTTGDVTASRGDHVYRNCALVGNTLAGVHCTGNNTIDHTLFLTTHWANTPFSFLRTGACTAGFMANTRIIHCAQENQGNSAMADLSTGGQPSWFNNVWDGSGWVQYDGYKYSGLASEYCFYLPNSPTGGSIRNDFNPFYPSPTTGHSTYNFGVGYQVPVYTDTGPKYYDFTNPRGQMIYANDYKYVTRTSTGTITGGDIVELLSDGTVQRATGTSTTKLIYGVAETDSTATYPVVVQISQGSTGFYPWSQSVSGAGIPLAQITGTYHKMGLASAYPANPIIGYSNGAGGNAGATARCEAFLRIP